MSNRISEIAVREALTILEDLRNPKWNDVYWEFQDEAKNVLFVINVSGLSAKEIDSFCSIRIPAAFDRLFPSNPGEIAWVATFYDRDLLVTAYHGNGVAPGAT